MNQKTTLMFLLLVLLLFHSMVFAKTAKNTSTPLTVSKSTNRNEHKSMRRQSSQKILALSSSGQSISKEEILGEDYYKPFDSKEIHAVLDPLINNIANLCQYNSLEQRAMQFKNTLEQLKKSIPIFLGKHNLQSDDHIFLLTIQSNVVEIFFDVDEKILEKIQTRQIAPARRFLSNYRLAYNVEGEAPLVFHYYDDWDDVWAEKIYTGLTCLEKEDANDDKENQEGTQ